MKQGYEHSSSLGETLATYYNDNGKQAFKIRSTKQGYQSYGCMIGIEPFFISYADASKMCTEEERQLPVTEWKKVMTKYICEAFEINYKEQLAAVK